MRIKVAGKHEKKKSLMLLFDLVLMVVIGIKRHVITTKNNQTFGPGTTWIGSD